MLLVTQHTATQTCRVHTTCYNNQHTYTQHMHRTQMICTSYHHQRPSSTLSMGGRRRGKWTVDVNLVNSEQHMYYIHLVVIKEQHFRGECLHRRLCHNHLMLVPLHWGCNPLTSSGVYYCQCGKTVYRMSQNFRDRIISRITAKRGDRNIRDKNIREGDSDTLHNT